MVAKIVDVKAHILSLVRLELPDDPDLPPERRRCSVSPVLELLRGGHELVEVGDGHRWLVDLLRSLVDLFNLSPNTRNGAKGKEKGSTARNC